MISKCRLRAKSKQGLSLRMTSGLAKKMQLRSCDFRFKNLPQNLSGNLTCTLETIWTLKWGQQPDASKSSLVTGSSRKDSSLWLLQSIPRVFRIWAVKAGMFAVSVWSCTVHKLLMITHGTRSPPPNSLHLSLCGNCTEGSLVTGLWLFVSDMYAGLIFNVRTSRTNFILTPDPMDHHSLLHKTAADVTSGSISWTSLSPQTRGALCFRKLESSGNLYIASSCRPQSPWPHWVNYHDNHKDMHLPRACRDHAFNVYNHNIKVPISDPPDWLMIAFIIWNSNLVPLLEGLGTSNPCGFEVSVFWVFVGIEPTTS